MTMAAASTRPKRKNKDQWLPQQRWLWWQKCVWTVRGGCSLCYYPLSFWWMRCTSLDSTINMVRDAVLLLKDMKTRHTQVYSQMLLDWLPSFLGESIRNVRPDLLPCRHWVWLNFARSLHVILLHTWLSQITCQLAKSSLQRKQMIATWIIPSLLHHAVGPLANLDGCYVADDSKERPDSDLVMSLTVVFISNGMNSYECWDVKKIND